MLVTEVKSLPTELPSALTKLVAVTTPAMTAPPSEKLTPIPGTLRWLILLSPKVISLDTVAELAAASFPIIILLLPFVRSLVPVDAAEYPIITLLVPVFTLSPAWYPNAVFWFPPLFKT